MISPDEADTKDYRANKITLKYYANDVNDNNRLRIKQNTYNR